MTQTKQEASSTAAFAMRKQNAAKLAAKYTQGKRMGEYVSIILFVILITANTFFLLRKLGFDETLGIFFISFLCGMTFADLMSGLVHWGADTWGTLETPLVGQTFIRSFREHHVDPFRITHHDVVEANGDNCLITLVPLAIMLYDLITNPNTNLWVISFFYSGAIWVSLTNQIHKWAHMTKPPPAVAFLQDCNIILSRKNHQVHHHTPFDRYYCITTGWLNYPLGKIGFWRVLETVVTSLTGAIPRQDDKRWTVQLDE